ncbi:MAG TPA: hypothetical protein VL588_12315 [Bdellovibrionota bacterium]|jgi:hypothetical protein|nr:hypothetical protein [Bdellovibrionota bacterium]
MKRSLLVLIAALTFAPVFANADDAAKPAGKGEKPCMKVKAACEAAGFKKGGHKDGNKGLHVDCMKKIMGGESVEGVTVSSSDVDACKAKRAAHHKG